MNHLSDEVFLSHVQRNLQVHDAPLAIDASVAVLRTVAESMDPDEAQVLADRLPPGLRRLSLIHI